MQWAVLALPTLEKGSLQDLAQAEVQRAGRIDLLGVCSGNQYNGDLLLAYISRLAPKFVIFRSADVLDAWIDAGLFAAQIRPHENYPYEAFKMTIHGLRHESISKTATARHALDKMQKLHFDHLPAVDDSHRFQFMLSRSGYPQSFCTHSRGCWAGQAKAVPGLFESVGFPVGSE
jgi:hypothetical protein